MYFLPLNYFIYLLCVSLCEVSLLAQDGLTKLMQTYDKQVLGSLRLQHQFQRKPKRKDGERNHKMPHVTCNPQECPVLPCYYVNLVTI